MTKIYVKGNGLIPQRFWDYSLHTDKNISSSFFEEKGFVYSLNSTNEYLNLSNEDRNKIKFEYVNSNKKSSV